ncbi:MAG: hypothetical protein AAF911_13820 [Planctomycetota bacterium]
MPRRSNAFQKLIKHLEEYSHSKDVRVTESALVYNPIVDDTQEIDILIEFTMGGINYRTGVHVEDRSRKAGPNWVRDTSRQRDEMGLDRIALVHSKGFTKQARLTANAYNVELISPNWEVDHPVAKLLFPIHRIHFKHVGLVSYTFTLPITEKDVANEDSIRFSGDGSRNWAMWMQAVAHFSIFNRLCADNQTLIPNTLISDHDVGYPQYIGKFSIHLPSEYKIDISDDTATFNKSSPIVIEACVECTSFYIDYPYCERMAYRDKKAFQPRSNSNHARPEILFCPDVNGHFHATVQMGGFNTPKKSDLGVTEDIFLSLDEIRKMESTFNKYDGSPKHQVHYSYQ